MSFTTFIENFKSKLLNKKAIDEASLEDNVLEGEHESRENDFTEKMGDLVEGEIPVSILIGFIPGAKRKDADSYVRGLMPRFCNDLEFSGYALQKFKGGYAYEIQEGQTGKSWLKSVLRYLDQHGRMVVPAGNRHIRLELEDSGLHCLMLRDNDPEMQKAIIPTGHGSLSPYHNYVQRWVSTSIGLAILSMAVFVFSLYTQKMLSENAAEKIVIETMSKTQTLPILYWPEVFKEDTYVAKLEFKNGRWSEPVFKSLTVEPHNPTPEELEALIDESENKPGPGYVPPPSIPGFPDITVRNELTNDKTSNNLAPGAPVTQ